MQEGYAQVVDRELNGTNFSSQNENFNFCEANYEY